MQYGKVLSFFVIVLAFASPTLNARESTRWRGVVCSAEAKAPLANVYIRTQSGDIVAVSDESGRYEFLCYDNCPSKLRLSLVGYADRAISLAKAGSDSDNAIDTVFLTVQPKIVDGIVVMSERDTHREAAADNVQNFERKQLLAASGSLNDPFRFLQQSPSVSIPNDFRNDLVIRGGNPTETVVIVEGFETANINHFGSQGSTGGPFSMLVSDQVGAIRLAGNNFSVKYPNRLSGLAEIDLLGREEINTGGGASLDLSGVSGNVRWGSKTKPLYLLAHARKSYLDLLKSRLNAPAVPQYADASIKTGYRISPSQSITLFSLAGSDRFELPPGVWGYANGRFAFQQDQVLSGVRWTSLLSPNTLIETGYALNYTRYDMKGDFDNHTANYINQSYERFHRLTFDLTSLYSEHIQLNLGGSYRATHADYPMSLANFRDEFGINQKWIRQVEELSIQEFSEYLELSASVLKALKITVGARHDFQDLANASLFSPRLSASYAVSPALTFFASAGEFGQTAPLIWQTSDKQNRTLDYIRATHYAVGATSTLPTGLRLTLTGYRKNYPNYPVTTIWPTRPMVDFATDYKFYEMRRIELCGHGFSQGLELTIEKTFGTALNFAAGGALLTSRYNNGKGREIDGDFDTDYSLNFATDLHPLAHWSLALRFAANGGRPYTPINEPISRTANYTYLDYRRLNQAHYAPYNRLDAKLTYDRQFSFGRMSIYLDVMNVYDRKNVYQYYWDSKTTSIQPLYQWQLLPVAGVAFDF